MFELIWFEPGFLHSKQKFGLANLDKFSNTKTCAKTISLVADSGTFDGDKDIYKIKILS